VSFFALLPCPILLILDLGRPGRFLNMVRVFRPSSPMSIGSWGLMGFSVAITGAAALQVTRLLIPPRHRYVRAGLAGAERVFMTLAGIGGLFLAGYTGTLLAATAVPLWSRRPALLGPLLLSSAAASGVATVAAVMALAPEPEPEIEEGLRRLELVAGLAEGVALTTWLYALGPTARPLMRGRLAPLVRHGVAGAGVALPLTLGALATLLPRPFQRAATLVSSALTLIGGYSLRYVVIHGGRESADDPGATFELTS
jgi:formate-dependent nitrite reductase membrane component NrfD